MKLDYVMYREDDVLCGWHGKVLGSMSSPHIATCWCYDGYVGDGFHCAGMAMSSLRSLQSFSCVFSFVIPEVKDTAARKLSRCQTGRGVLGLCTLCQHVFEQFSEAKPLSIIRAFKWYFPGQLGIFSHRKYNNETILKGNDY